MAVYTQLTKGVG